MGEIRILPEILSNQIAAGEVVQRPVSVVKELVENSIDAGADNIVVEIEKGGKSLIRISDNGIGLSRDQALLSIERYATSKIFSKEDLFSISTFGFRGEALPSIASVSKFTMVSRTRESNTGVQLVIHGGKLSSVSDAGAPEGTLVEVKHLFFNTPARRKFLKADATEAGHIADALSGMALGNPDVGFKLIFNGKLNRHFPAGQDLFHRAMGVLGRDVKNSLYSLDHGEGEVTITGVCANPGVTRSTANRLFLFVNNRLVHDRGVVAAVFKGYQGRIMKGRYPVGVICICLPFDQVDVNVHPSKREVKFINPRPIYLAVTRAVEAALRGAQTDINAYSGAPVVTEAPASYAFDSPSQKAADMELDLSWQPFPREGASKPFYSRDEEDRPEILWSQGEELSSQGPSSTAPLAEERNLKEPSPQDPVKPRLPNGQRTQPSPGQEPSAPAEPCGIPSAQPVSVKDRPAKPKVLGQVMGTYIVAEFNDRLMLVDQHAAHERIVYEKLRARHRGLGVQSQQLLVPETLELGHREADLLNGILPELAGLGLVIEPFGGNTFIIKSSPSILTERSVEEMVMNIVETLLETQDGSATEIWLENCLISMACHTAIRANKPMHGAEMEALLDELFTCENPLHCPHGRPTLITFDAAHMEKMFKRVV